jgi:hypothetical protein
VEILLEICVQDLSNTWSRNKQFWAVKQRFAANVFTVATSLIRFPTNAGVSFGQQLYSQISSTMQMVFFKEAAPGMVVGASEKLRHLFKRKVSSAGTLLSGLRLLRCLFLTIAEGKAVLPFVIQRFSPGKLAQANLPNGRTFFALAATTLIWFFYFGYMYLRPWILPVLVSKTVAWLAQQTAPNSKSCCQRTAYLASVDQNPGCLTVTSHSILSSFQVY